VRGGSAPLTHPREPGYSSAKPSSWHCNCTVLYCTVLHCSALHCSPLLWSLLLARLCLDHLRTYLIRPLKPFNTGHCRRHSLTSLPFHPTACLLPAIPQQDRDLPPSAPLPDPERTLALLLSLPWFSHLISTYLPTHLPTFTIHLTRPPPVHERLHSQFYPIALIHNHWPRRSLQLTSTPTTFFHYNHYNQYDLHTPSTPSLRLPLPPAVSVDIHTHTSSLILTPSTATPRHNWEPPYATIDSDTFASNSLNH
jgi:hypothetical protein